MSEEDVALYLEWSIADGEEVANEVCGVECLNCGDVVILEPGTRQPVASRSRVEVIESMDDAEPHSVRIYCSDDCRNDDLLQTDGGRCTDGKPHRFTEIRERIRHHSEKLGYTDTGGEQ